MRPNRVEPLGARLLRAAEYVRPGGRVADVGTDHAHLPIYLIRAGIARSVVACDVNRGPLRSARENLARAGLEERVALRLCDGLAGVSPDEADDIVIAGMGGELIARILASAPWTADPAKRLILQPMSSAEELRAFLCAHGFEILRESAVRDAGKLYAVLCAEYTGRVVEPEPAYCYLGELPRAGGEPEAAYLRLQARRLSCRARGLRCAGAQEEAAGLDRLALRLEEAAAQMNVSARNP